MRAIVQDGYGSPDDLELRDVATPAVKDDEVLVRVRAASVNPADWHFMRGMPYIARLAGRSRGMGLREPGNPVRGRDVAGHVEAVGKAVTRFAPGDEVFGESDGNGAFAEYVSVPEGTLGPKPANLTFEQAAAVPLAANTALQGLRDAGKLQPGQRVLINGASGGVGTFAVQLAKAFGAEVTGVCSARNVDMVRSLGAAEVIDYTQQDFTAGGQRYDLVFSLAGTRSPLDLRRALTPKGTLVLCSGEGGRWVGPIALMLQALVVSRFVGQSLGSFLAKQSSEDLLVLKERIEAGHVTPVIDRTYQLSEVPEAIRYVEQGHARGKVVISV